VCLSARDGAGLRCVFRQLAEPDSDFEKVAGQAAVGTIIPFDRAPILRGVITTLRPHYIGDADELVGRMAMAIPAVAANARRVSELLHMSTMLAGQHLEEARPVGPGRAGADDGAPRRRGGPAGTIRAARRPGATGPRPPRVVQR